MSNPVLVEVTRGDFVESRHRGAVCVVDGDGRTIFAVGDTARPVFPRSAVKAIQALPLVESGAADAYGFGDRELAMACASHQGEAGHAALAASMLAKAGLGEPALGCGVHWPFGQEATLALARAGDMPTQLHNNCSGKHAGFLCTCCHDAMPVDGYVEPGHPLQDRIAETMQAVTGVAHDAGNRAIDGCSIPTYAVPLAALATGFARLATGNGLAPQRAAAARRLLGACMAEPWYVAGTGKADTELMRLAPGRLFVKTGAEGVYCAALPEHGFGIALKCDDGGTRASECMVATVLAGLVRSNDPDLAVRLGAFADAAIPTRKGVTVGMVRPTAALAGILA